MAAVAELTVRDTFRGGGGAPKRVDPVSSSVSSAISCFSRELLKIACHVNINVNPNSEPPIRMGSMLVLISMYTEARGTESLQWRQSHIVGSGRNREIGGALSETF